jgi:hypothetical protein
MEAKTLSVYPITDYTMGPYNYYVVTPEGDYMYFSEKKEARSFIEFYHDYSSKMSQQKLTKTVAKIQQHSF